MRLVAIRGGIGRAAARSGACGLSGRTDNRLNLGIGVTMFLGSSYHGTETVVRKAAPHEAPHRLRAHAKLLGDLSHREELVHQLERLSVTMSGPNQILPPHLGVLTQAEIADGINATNDNAFRLLTDSVLLYLQKRHPSSSTLALLSIEESGKAVLLRRLLRETTPSGRRRIWSQWGRHKAKSTAALQNFADTNMLKVEDRKTFEDLRKQLLLTPA